MNFNNKPQISIIIPNFNNEKYISDCLESCINQTYHNIEIIVVDDASNDNSVNLIKSFQKEDSRIILIQNETNRHVAKTRHIGISSSTSNWVTTLDGDDLYLSKKKIENEVSVLSDYNFNDEVIVYSGIITIDRVGNPEKYLLNECNAIEGNIFNYILTRKGPIPRDFIFSKKIYFAIDGFDFDIPIYEDWDIKIRLSKFAKFIYSGIDRGIGYRQHGEGLSSTNINRHFKWFNYIFNKNSIDLANKKRLKIKLITNSKYFYLKYFISKYLM